MSNAPTLEMSTFSGVTLFKTSWAIENPVSFTLQLTLSNKSTALVSSRSDNLDSGPSHGTSLNRGKSWNIVHFIFSADKYRGMGEKLSQVKLVLGVRAYGVGAVDCSVLGSARLKVHHSNLGQCVSLSGYRVLALTLGTFRVGFSSLKTPPSQTWCRVWG